MDDKKVKVLSTGYTVYDLINSVLGAAEPDAVQANTTEYLELLNTIRERISEEHANTLNSILTNPNAHNVLMPIILSYVTDYVNTTNDVTININRTAARIYQDMAGFGILTPYLNDPTVEEININAWNSIEVLWSNREEQLEDTFSSSTECTDIVRKMVRIGGKHIDYSQPIIDSFIGDGTRISATLPPVNADHIGATASIRKQTFKRVTREKYLAMGFATEKVWDFMDMAIKHNVSMGIAGSPGAGKTTMMTCLLRSFMNDKKVGNNRICVIEEAREIDLEETEEFNPFGGHPRMTSRVLQYTTTGGEHPVTARMLIRHALRVNPQIIVPAEMRGEEAIEAVEAGLTGVQIVSSFHAWGAKDGYVRVQSMCQMGHGNTSESALLQMIIRAFPIMVFIKKDDDGVRRVHEIFEATGVKGSKVVGNTLFKFIRTKVYENEEGRIINIEGKFVQYESISKDLRRLLIQNGAKKDMVDNYYFEGENPEHPEQYDEGDVEIITVMSAPAEDVVHVEVPRKIPAAPVNQEPIQIKAHVPDPVIEQKAEDIPTREEGPRFIEVPMEPVQESQPKLDIQPEKTLHQEPAKPQHISPTPIPVISTPPPIVFDDELDERPQRKEEPAQMPQNGPARRLYDEPAEMTSGSDLNSENMGKAPQRRFEPSEEPRNHTHRDNNETKSVQNAAKQEPYVHSAFEEGEKEDLMPYPKSKGFWGGVRDGRGKK